MNTDLKRRIEQIRRRWWVVLAVTVLVVVGTAIPTLTAHATYTAKTALVMSSPGRSPAEDAMMTVGYATMFNEPATIRRLAEGANIPSDVTFEAQTVAASPILLVEATADTPEVAQDAATNMAGAFRDDLNAVRGSGSSDALADLEKELAQLQATAPAAPDGSPNPMLAVLRERIDAMRFDTTNQLMDLQPRAGVTTNAPNTVFNLAMGLLGGLVLGCVVALLLSSFSKKIRNAADLQEKTGISPLVEVPGPSAADKAGTRDASVRALAHTVSLQDCPKSTVLAVADTRGTRAARGLAGLLAKLSAQQGKSTILVHATNDTATAGKGEGFNEALLDAGLIHSVQIDASSELLKIVPGGRVVKDRYPRMTRERIEAVIGELRAYADTIIVVSPSMESTTEAQLICAAADLTVLTVAKDTTRADDVTSAVEALTTARANLLGAVLTDATNQP